LGTPSGRVACAILNLGRQFSYYASTLEHFPDSCAWFGRLLRLLETCFSGRPRHATHRCHQHHWRRNGFERYRAGRAQLQRAEWFLRYDGPIGFERCSLRGEDGAQRLHLHRGCRLNELHCYCEVEPIQSSAGQPSLPHFSGGSDNAGPPGTIVQPYLSA